jgi:hypothetical protein
MVTAQQVKVQTRKRSPAFRADIAVFGTAALIFSLIAVLLALFAGLHGLPETPVFGA